MYCSECGVKAIGKFCHNCGSSLHVADTAVVLPGKEVAPLNADWEHDPQYENIVRVEAIRRVISQHAENAPTILSGEAILAVYDKVMSSPIPLEKLAAIVQPLYDSWGIRTGKERVELLSAPIGRAIARSLCSLARNGQKLMNVEQHDHGCVLSAELPSSVCALKGTLSISLRACELRTHVVATTTIPGQLFDWGKSNRCLDHFFNDMTSDLGLPTERDYARVA